MSEKRFVIKKGSSGDYDIYDNLKGDYFIGDSSLPVNSFAEEIVDLLNEQQVTIRKLQDLCGQSDGENAKLRQENKELEEECDDYSNFLIDKGLEFEFEKWCKDE